MTVTKLVIISLLLHMAIPATATSQVAQTVDAPGQKRRVENNNNSKAYEEGVRIVASFFDAILPDSQSPEREGAERSTFRNSRSSVGNSERYGELFPNWTLLFGKLFVASEESATLSDARGRKPGVKTKGLRASRDVGRGWTFILEGHKSKDKLYEDKTVHDRVEVSAGLFKTVGDLLTQGGSSENLESRQRFGIAGNVIRNQEGVSGEVAVRYTFELLKGLFFNTEVAQNRKAHIRGGLYAETEDRRFRVSVEADQTLERRKRREQRAEVRAEVRF